MATASSSGRFWCIHSSKSSTSRASASQSGAGSPRQTSRTYCACSSTWSAIRQSNVTRTTDQPSRATRRSRWPTASPTVCRPATKYIHRNGASGRMYRNVRPGTNAIMPIEASVRSSATVTRRRRLVTNPMSANPLMPNDTAIVTRADPMLAPRMPVVPPRATTSSPLSSGPRRKAGTMTPLTLRPSMSTAFRTSWAGRSPTAIRPAAGSPGRRIENRSE